MKQFFKMVFAGLCALALFTVLIFVFFIGAAVTSASGSKPSGLEDKSILLLNLNQNIVEQTQDNPFDAFSGGMGSNLGLNDILTSLRDAKNNKQIKGIYIRTGVCPIGWASLQEMREALEDFKKSGKFIVAYGEICDQKSLYISSVTKEHYLNPAGGMEFNGLSITGMFYKGALDKLEVETEAFHCGQYKGAYEPYKLEKYSDPNRYQLQTLLNDMHGQFLMAVANKAGKDTATLAMWSRTGLVKFPNDALQNKLVDGLAYADSVDLILKKKCDLSEKDKLRLVSADDYVEQVDLAKTESNKIAVLYAEGTIYDGEGQQDIYSKTFAKNVRKIAQDDDIKAVVLRVNSPGGSALASEVMYHELMQLKKKKPIIVSMGNYAASGGYYLACAGDSIVADANTLTGSIGVVGVMFNIGNMLKNKLGVTTDAVTTGTYSDFPNMTRKMTDAERNWIQSYLDSTYIMFKTRVATARRMSMEQVEALAQGHVYSGTLGKQIGLVDILGGKERALQSAASKAKLNKYEVVEYPKPIDKVEQLITAISGKKREEAAIRRFLGDDFAVYDELRKIRQQDQVIQARMPWMDIK
jgi:protease-4